MKKNFILNVFRFRSGIVLYSFLLALLNLLLIQLPLTGTFGYEFAAINGFLLTIISGFFTLKSISKADYKLSILALNLLIILVVPLVIIIVYSIFTMFCSFCDGLGFYVLIVTTSTLFGSAISFVVDFVLNRFKKTIFLIIIFLVALIPVLEIYFLPQVYFYSPLIGFFPGNIYDEGLSPDLKLLSHQAVVSLFSGLMIFLVIKYRRYFNSKKILLITLIFCLSVAFQYSSSWFGFSTTYSSLENDLNKEISSDQIILHYDKLNEMESEFLKLCAYYYYSELENVLQVKPSKQIHIYIFNSREQKKVLFGAGNADVAKPWQYAIYISADSWEHTLKHELVHIFSAEFGTGPFKLAAGFNPALIEGLAEAIEGTTDEYALKDFTALAFNNIRRIDLNSLFTGLNFFKSNSSLSYSYSGAFIQYLIKKFEIVKVKQFYSNNDFEKTFNANLTSEIKLFENELHNNTILNDYTMADYYFGRLSILQKVCPRFISDRLNVAYIYLNEKKYDEAEKLFKEINQKTTNYSASVGLAEIYVEKNNYKAAIKLLSNDFNKFKNTPYSYFLTIKMCDLYILSDEIEIALFDYNYIIKNNPHKDLVRLAKLRKDLFKNNLIKQYLTGNDSVKFNCVKQLNDSTYNYNSIPILINLFQSQNVNYNNSLSVFNKTFIVDNLESSYAAFRLSKYMLANFDFVNGRKYAALSLRYKEENPFYLVMKENYEMANSFFINNKKISSRNIN